MNNILDLHTVLQGRKLVTSRVSSDQDRELISKLVDLLLREEVSTGKAMAVLDATRTALLKQAMDSSMKSLRMDD